MKNVKSKLYFYTLGDYIARRFADVQPACHLSNMAATGLYDLKNNMWNTNIIYEICDREIVFPRKASEEDGYVIIADRKGIRYYIYPAIGDQQAALLGAGFGNSGDLSFNLGTGGQVSVLAEKPDLSADYQIRPYFMGKYIKTIPHIPSGRALNVYIRFFEDIFRQFKIETDRDEIWAVLLKAADQTDAEKLVCDMSFFENSITEHNVGSITNIGEYDLCAGALMNGILKQMIKNFVLAADMVQPDRKKVKRIIFSGGVAKKIEKIRSGIAKHYLRDIEIQIAANETLIGLYKYGNSGVKLGE